MASTIDAQNPFDLDVQVTAEPHRTAPAEPYTETTV
jgi:hypothetical protein